MNPNHFEPDSDNYDPIADALELAEAFRASAKADAEKEAAEAAAQASAKAEQSRINGSKSHGPVTPEGKAISSGNRMTHGFRSHCVVLATEDKDQYNAHLDSYLAQYAPENKVEEDLVGLLASSMWQLMRNNAVEVALLDIELSTIDNDIKGKFKNIDEYGRLAFAFKKSAGNNALELLRRYKATAERTYHKTLQALEHIQKNRKAVRKEPQQTAAVRTWKHPDTSGNSPQPKPQIPLLTLVNPPKQEPK